MTQNTAWMWRDGDQVRGLSLDLEDGILSWHTNIGCHCSQHSDVEQAVDAFRQNGPPAFLGPLPDDVAAEVGAALTLVEPAPS